MAFNSLDEVLKQIIQWEKRLDTFYDLMEEYLTHRESRQTAEVLKRQQEKALGMLDTIDIKQYEHIEFIKNIPDYRSEDIIPHFEISADSSPAEVFETILSYEEKLEKYYTHIRDVLTYTESKDLFDMLIQHKLGQIKEIKALMDNYDLTV